MSFFFSSGSGVPFLARGGVPGGGAWNAWCVAFARSLPIRGHARDTKRNEMSHAPRVLRATKGLRARGGTESESPCGSAWFGSVRAAAGILDGIARVRFSHRESTSPDPL